MRTPAAAIASISVCSPTGTGGAGSCPPGTSDTHQIVLAPDGSGKAINSYSDMVGISDEHQSIFAPGSLQTNDDYLFFVASHVKGGAPSTGVVVLSGGAGPDKNGQWTLDFARVDGYGSYASGYGTVFVAPTGPDCPTVAGGNPTHQDATFDLTYAAPGSVVVDPTSPAGSLLMIYEGTNTCFGIASGANKGNNFYSSVGIATSLDYGHTWPTYRGDTNFSFVQLPGENPSQGPDATTGALGDSVCSGDDCTTTPPASYGRYAVLSPSVSISTAMALGTSIPSSMGDSEMSGFVDDAGGDPGQYVYVVYDYKPGTGSLADPKAPSPGLMIARARLDSGSAPLSFLKWNGTAFAGAGMGGYDTSIFPTGSFANCEAASQLRYGASLSYVDETQQYLLTFVCDSQETLLLVRPLAPLEVAPGFIPPATNWRTRRSGLRLRRSPAHGPLSTNPAGAVTTRAFTQPSCRPAREPDTFRRADMCSTYTVAKPTTHRPRDGNTHRALSRSPRLCAGAVHHEVAARGGRRWIRYPGDATPPLVTPARTNTRRCCRRRPRRPSPAGTRRTRRCGTPDRPPGLAPRAMTSETSRLR